MAAENFRLEQPNGIGEAAYLYLPGHPQGPGSVASQVRLHDLLPDYIGPDVYLDLDANRRLIGIEVLR